MSIAFSHDAVGNPNYGITNDNRGGSLQALIATTPITVGSVFAAFYVGRQQLDLELLSHAMWNVTLVRSASMMPVVLLLRLPVDIPALVEQHGQQEEESLTSEAAVPSSLGDPLRKRRRRRRASPCAAVATMEPTTPSHLLGDLEEGAPEKTQPPPRSLVVDDGVAPDDDDDEDVADDALHPRTLSTPVVADVLAPQGDGTSNHGRTPRPFLASAVAASGRGGRGQRPPSHLIADGVDPSSASLTQKIIATAAAIQDAEGAEPPSERRKGTGEATHGSKRGGGQRGHSPSPGDAVAGVSTTTGGVDAYQQHRRLLAGDGRRLRHDHDDDADAAPPHSSTDLRCALVEIFSTGKCTMLHPSTLDFRLIEHAAQRATRYIGEALRSLAGHRQAATTALNAHGSVLAAVGGGGLSSSSSLSQVPGFSMVPFFYSRAFVAKDDDDDDDDGGAVDVENTAPRPLMRGGVPSATAAVVATPSTTMTTLVGFRITNFNAVVYPIKVLVRLALRRQEERQQATSGPRRGPERVRSGDGGGERLIPSVLVSRGDGTSAGDRDTSTTMPTRPDSGGTTTATADVAFSPLDDTDAFLKAVLVSDGVNMRLIYSYAAAWTPEVGMAAVHQLNSLLSRVLLLSTTASSRSSSAASTRTAPTSLLSAVSQIGFGKGHFGMHHPPLVQQSDTAASSALLHFSNMILHMRVEVRSTLQAEPFRCRAVVTLDAHTPLERTLHATIQRTGVVILRGVSESLQDVRDVTAVFLLPMTIRALRH